MMEDRRPYEVSHIVATKSVNSVESMMASVPLTRTCSWDESFEQVDYSDPWLDQSEHNIVREKPLNRENFNKLFDADGRLVDEQSFREAVFKGGVSPDVRPDAWKFLFGLYPFSSTASEREILALEYHCRYQALKSRWKSVLAKIKPADENENLLHPSYLPDPSKQRDDDKVEDDFVVIDKITVSGDEKLSEEVKQQKQFTDIQAQVYAGRQPYEMSVIRTAIKVIDKDVPRTDRDHKYFIGDENPNLGVLRDILITFATFHPDVGYAQGMNDVLSRFLVVLDSEVEAYWCFVKFMDDVYSDFIESGMLRKLTLLQDLLRQLDRRLYNHLEECCVSDLLFAHRWLMLSFKREFPFDDALLVFEVISSNYMEFHSVLAERERDMERARDFERAEGGKIRMTEVRTVSDLSFDLFIALAFLIEIRPILLHCQDTADVFQTVNGVFLTSPLDDILCRAENVFLMYCRRTALEEYQLIDCSPIS
ncbi:TBC1 domain family member 15-like isoform X2 [Ptychodera flava]|uniref:TBC1 domain family member 15-like isoform X2 n=1 Tax=Ptychodera flava TaxID=63121 RepID=UPI00396AA92A